MKTKVRAKGTDGKGAFRGIRSNMGGTMRGTKVHRPKRGKGGYVRKGRDNDRLQEE